MPSSCAAASRSERKTPLSSIMPLPLLNHSIFVPYSVRGISLICVFASTSQNVSAVISADFASVGVPATANSHVKEIVQPRIAYTHADLIVINLTSSFTFHLCHFVHLCALCG